MVSDVPNQYLTGYGRELNAAKFGLRLKKERFARRTSEPSRDCGNCERKTMDDDGSELYYDDLEEFGNKEAWEDAQAEAEYWIEDDSNTDVDYNDELMND